MRSISLPPSSAFEPFKLHVRSHGLSYSATIVSQSWIGSYSKPKLIGDDGRMYEEIPRPEDDPIDYEGARFGIRVGFPPVKKQTRAVGASTRPPERASRPQGRRNQPGFSQRGSER